VKMPAHDPSTHSGSRPASVAAGTPTIANRPRWLMAALAVGIVAVGLVATGVLSLSTVLYAGLFGGMILMHVGGHGHGGHGRSGSHARHGAGIPRDEDLSRPSPGSQPASPRSSSGLEDRASDDPKASETHDHDQRNTHSCH